MNTKNSTKKSAGFYPAIIICIAAAVIFDRFTKHLAVLHLKDKSPYVLIKGVLELHYLENRGAAWGMLQGKQWIFWIITVLFLLICVLYFKRVPADKKYRPLTITVTFLAAGAIGNFIDRAVQKYVVDFIYFSIIDFPIFNVADIYVSLAMVALLILILFHYKDQDFDFIKKAKQ